MKIPCIFTLFTIAMISSVSAADNDVSRWAIVPAANQPIMVSGTPYFFAWLLDTKTGQVKFCTYQPGGWEVIKGKAPMPETLECTNRQP